MTKRKIRLIAATLIGLGLSSLFIDAYVVSFKKMEIIGLYKLYQLGSGVDDGVTDYLYTYPEEYAAELVNILADAKPGTPDERMALTFIPYVVQVSGVNQALIEIAEAHPVEETRCNILQIADGEAFLIPLNTNSGGVSVFVVDESKLGCD